MFSAVPKEALDIVWGDVKKLLEPAVETAKGKMTLKDDGRDWEEPTEEDMQRLDEEESENIIPYPYPDKDTIH